MAVCGACKGEVPDGASACMHCGRRLTPRAWIPWATIGLVAVLMLGFAWNQNRLEQERSDYNVCLLMDESDC